MSDRRHLGTLWWLQPIILRGQSVHLLKDRKPMSTLDPWQVLERRAWEDPSVWGSGSDTATDTQNILWLTGRWNVTERLNGKGAALFIIFLCWGPQNTTNGHMIPIEGIIYTTNLPTKHIVIWIVFFAPKEALSNNNSSDNAVFSCSVVSDSVSL